MNTFGNLFRITLYGESHGPEIGVIVDGCPSGISILQSDFVNDINRRRPSQNGTTTRTEDDTPIINSGIYKNFTTGSPINISFRNSNFCDEDYQFDGFYRPSHADFVANVKFKGYNNPLGGGMFSGRLTLPIVAAGCIAKKIISEVAISASLVSPTSDEILAAQQAGDSLGGIVKCSVRNLQVGIGEPFFMGLESCLAQAIFSIPGVKALDFGNGIASARMRGSEYNDPIIDKSGKTLTNNSGGINGGISNGNEVVFTTYFHPTPSIAKTQQVYNFAKQKVEDFNIKGRHDTCFALRTPVIIEAMTAIVLADLKLIDLK